MTRVGKWMGAKNLRRPELRRMEEYKGRDTRSGRVEEAKGGSGVARGGEELLCIGVLVGRGEGS